MFFYIDELALINGKKHICSNGLMIKNPILKEIVDFGESKYNSLVDLFCSKPYDYMVQLDDLGISWNEVSNFDIFTMLFSTDLEDYNKSLSWLFDLECNFDKYLNQENGETVFFDEEKNIKIDRLIYEEISNYLKFINFISEEREFNPGDYMARMMVLEQERKRIKRLMRHPKPPESRLSCLISFLVWNNTSGMRYEDIFNLSIYQFHDGVKRLLKTDNYRNKMFGYYSGNIDPKNLDIEKIHWANRTTTQD